jgi:hypothetical protein
MHVPLDLDGWTAEVIETLAATRVNEDQRFDFKSGSMARNPQAVNQISKAVSAFANSDGGFLVFGVDEKKPTGTGWEPNPFEPTTQFAQLFHQKIKVEPAVEYPAPKELPVSRGKSYYVVHIPPSRFGPHASTAYEGCVFYHRTHEGSVPMAYNHLRDAILGAETRRATVRVLIHELDHALRLALQHKRVEYSNSEDLDVTQFDLGVLRDTISRLHTSIAGDVHAMEDLMGAMRCMQRANGTLQMAMLQMGTMGTDTGKVWGRRVRSEADSTAQALNRARLAVGRVFNIEVPNWVRST